MAINGFLDLGVALSGTTVVTPPSGTNYAPQPVAIDVITGGVLLSNINCVFGPVSGSWGTLTCFGVTDGSGNALTGPGTLQQPFTPLNGQLVVVPPGNIQLVVGSQFAAGPGAYIAPFTTQGTSGPTLSGAVGLNSLAYTLIVPSGGRNMVSVQNDSQIDTIKLVLGGLVAPASGTAPTAVLPPFGTWPPPGQSFVPTDAVWAIAGQLSGTVASFLTGSGTATARNTSGPTTSGSVALSSGAYSAVLAGGNYNTVSLQNMAQGDVVKLRVGDNTQPASGAVPTVVLRPFDTWPPPGIGFVPSSPVWAIAATQASGTNVSFLVG